MLGKQKYKEKGDGRVMKSDFFFHETINGQKKRENSQLKKNAPSAVCIVIRSSLTVRLGALLG